MDAQWANLIMHGIILYFTIVTLIRLGRTGSTGTPISSVCVDDPGDTLLYVLIASFCGFIGNGYMLIYYPS